eukprot:5456394-Amphidinium_carterae.1
MDGGTRWAFLVCQRTPSDFPQKDLSHKFSFANTPLGMGIIEHWLQTKAGKAVVYVPHLPNCENTTRSKRDLPS